MAVLRAFPFRAERFPLCNEVLVKDGQSDVGQQRREDPTLGCAGDRVPVDGTLTEDPGPQERPHQAEDTLVPDATSHSAHQGHVVDLIEARRDVSLEHPLVVSSG